MTARRLTIAATLLIVHSLIGVGIWAWFIYGQTVLLTRVVAPENVGAAIVEWLPFFSRSWRSVVPLLLSVVALCFIRRRRTLAFRVLAFVAVATVTVAAEGARSFTAEFAVLRRGTDRSIRRFASFLSGCQWRDGALRG